MTNDDNNSGRHLPPQDDRVAITVKSMPWERELAEAVAHALAC